MACHFISSLCFPRRRSLCFIVEQLGNIYFPTTSLLARCTSCLRPGQFFARNHVKFVPEKNLIKFAHTLVLSIHAHSGRRFGAAVTRWSLSSVNSHTSALLAFTPIGHLKRCPVSDKCLFRLSQIEAATDASRICCCTVAAAVEFLPPQGKNDKRKSKARLTKLKM